MVNFKKFLKLLSPKEQLCEINYMISEFSKSNRPSDNINKMLKELGILKQQIIFKKKENLQKYSQNNYSKLLYFIMDKHFQSLIINNHMVFILVDLISFNSS